MGNEYLLHTYYTMVKAVKVNLDQGTSWMNNDEARMAEKDEVWKVCKFTIRNQISCFIAFEGQGYLLKVPPPPAKCIYTLYYLRVLCGLISNSPVLRELWLSVMINYCIHRPLTCNSHVLDNQFGHHSIELNSVWTMTSVPIHTIFTTPLQKFNLIRPHHHSTIHHASIHHVEVQL